MRHLVQCVDSRVVCDDFVNFHSHIDELVILDTLHIPPICSAGLFVGVFL